MHTAFLNVDLDLKSDGPLDAIVEAFGDQAVVLRHDRVGQRFVASFQVAGIMPNANSTIDALCDLVQALPPPARAVWDACRRRVLDIGIQSGPAPDRFHAVIDAATVRRAGDLGCAIVVTVYGQKFGSETP